MREKHLQCLLQVLINLLTPTKRVKIEEKYKVRTKTIQDIPKQNNN